MLKTPIAATLAAALLCSAGGTASAERKTILAHYMPWYETPEVRGFWGLHWTGFNDEADPTQIVGPDGRRDIWSNYYPLIEPYDSADPDLLECHLLQMKLAGIDGVLADWYGLSGAADYGIIHVATEALFDATADFGMEFGVVFEDRTYEFRVNNGLLPANQVNSDLLSTFQWMQANWFTAPHYAFKDGRPLLLNFGPIYLQSPTPWSIALSSLNPRPLLFSLSNLWTTNGSDGAFTWVRPSIFEDFPSSPVARQRTLDFFTVPGTTVDTVIPSANPGFDDVYAVSFPDIPYRDGDTLRDMLTVAMDGDWSHIQFVTWNDYGEGTMIEPTREFGYLFLEIVQEARRDELGSAFTFTADDLRLPARLYEMRKTGAASDATLDAVSDLRNQGDPGAARLALDIIDGVDVPADPAGGLFEAGGLAVLSAPLSSTGPGVSISWSRDGTPLVDGPGIVGSGTPTLTIAGATPFDTGLYRVRIEVAGLSVESEPALVAVRGSGLGPVDANFDGVVTRADLEAFITAHGTVAP